MAFAREFRNRADRPRHDRIELMILPFVRELFADAEKSPAFARAAAALKMHPQGGATAGRISLSGLTRSAKSLYLPLLRRAATRPLIVIVENNRAADELLPVVQAFCELTGACDPAAVLAFPAHDVLPYDVKVKGFW